MAISNQHTSIYVGDIPVTLPRPEETINSLFSSIAPVVSVKVCRDIQTQKSLGYGYVNFQTAADAEKAIQALNYTEIEPGRQIRVMVSMRDPLQRRSGANNVCVRKLDTAVTAKTLQEAFNACGRILSCKVAMTETGESKGYGFVQFETAEGAKAGLAMDGKKVGDSEVAVSPFLRRVEREAQVLKTFTGIYVKNIKSSAEEKTVKAAFEKYGAVESIFVADHPQHDTKFALIAYKEHDSAVKSIEELHESDSKDLTDGEVKLHVCRALSKSERQREKQKNSTLFQNHGRNLYVKHLPDDITQDRLNDLFATYGPITSCALMKDATGQFRGFGFVCFENKEDAVTAMRTLNGKSIDSTRRPLYVSQAEQKDMRIRLLQQRRAAMRQQQRMMPPMGMMPPQQWGRQPFPPMHPSMMQHPHMGMPPFMPGPGMRPPMMPPMGHMPPRPQQNRYNRPPQNMQPPYSEAVDVNYVNSLPLEQQKNYLGEMLYGRISQVDASNAAKITGMLLEMSKDEIFGVLSNRNTLMEKIKEANAVLQEHQGN